jgi:hypothetical protein
MKHLILPALVFGALFGSAPAAIPRGQEPLDGPKKPFQDELVDRLAGKWTLTRKMRGKESQNTLEAVWVLNHQFLQLHMKDDASPPEYEAIVYLGYDHTSERYVVHWLDGFGGRTSETLGYGKRDGDSIRFFFEYPDGPFHNTFTWHPDSKTWSTLLESKSPAGQWSTFAEETLRRVP